MECVFPESIHIFPMDNQWNFHGCVCVCVCVGGGGGVIKMPKIPKGRGYLYEIIFQEGHARLAKVKHLHVLMYIY